MNSSDAEALRREYAAMTDEAIAYLHAEGPSAYSDDAGWRLLDREYRRRGDSVVAIENAMREDMAESAVDPVKRTAFLTLVAIALVGIVIGSLAGAYASARLMRLQALSHPSVTQVMVIFASMAVGMVLGACAAQVLWLRVMRRRISVQMAWLYTGYQVNTESILGSACRTMFRLGYGSEPPR